MADFRLGEVLIVLIHFRLPGHRDGGGKDLVGISHFGLRAMKFDETDRRENVQAHWPFL